MLEYILDTYGNKRGKSKLKALVNACIYDFESFSDDCFILFNSDIEQVGKMKDYKGAEEVYDCRGCIVMPGLANCHTHIYSTFSRGMSIPFKPKSFSDILTQLWWKLDGNLDNEGVYRSGLVYGIDCIKSGVTSIIDHHASGLSIKGSLNMLKKAVCSELGLRGIFCFETSDRFDVEECIRENLEFSRNRDEYYAGMFGMHASMSLGDESLKRISERTGNLPVHIHVAESRDDVEDCQRKYKKGIVERLDSFGLLRENSILAHCVHLNDEEISCIKERGCIIALNPTSNMNNAVGLVDFDMLKRNNARCMVGNDGLGANITRDHSNIVFAMKHRLKNPTGFGLQDLVSMINNGYEYTGNVLNIKIGRIRQGFKADMIVVPYIPPTPMDETNVLGHLFFGMFDNFHPRDVWVSGRCLMKEYKTRVDIGSVYYEARIEAVNIWNRIK